MYIILGIISVILNFVTMFYVFRNYKRRKKSNNNEFEVYSEHGPFYPIIFLLSFTFSFILLYIGVYASEEFRSSLGLLLFLITFVSQYRAASISYKCIIYKGDTFYICKRLFFKPKAISLSEIKKVKYYYNNIYAYDDRRMLFKLSTVCINIGRLNVLLEKNNILKIFPSHSNNNNEFQRKIIVKMPIVYKIIIPLLLFVLKVGGLCMALHSEKIVIGYVIVIIMVISNCFVILAGFRYQIVIEADNIYYTPLLGKEKIFSVYDVHLIEIHYTEIRHQKSYYINIAINNGSKIYNIPYKYYGIQEAIEYFRLKGICVKGRNLDEIA